MFVCYEESILTYIACIRNYFGLDSSYIANPDFSKLLKEKQPKKIFLILIDAMGSYLIKEKLDEDSFLRRNMLFETTTVFPSTTTAATTSVIDGKAPNENAWLGWNQYFKEVDDEVIPFMGKGYYSHKDYGYNYVRQTIPYLSTEKELISKGISATSIEPYYAVNGCHNIDEMCNRLIKYSHNDEYRYIYAYWDKYDTYCHEHGPNSKICDSYLEYINYELENLANNIKDDTMLVIVADHGQIEVGKVFNLYGSKYEKYLRLRPSLETRCVSFFIKEDLKEEFEKEFKNDFEDEFILLSHEDVLDTKIFGENKNHQRFEDFIGDYIAIGKSDSIIIYDSDYDNGFRGHHAGCLKEELGVPVIIYQK